MAHRLAHGQHRVPWYGGPAEDYRPGTLSKALI
jgi:hypothetical protein